MAKEVFDFKAFSSLAIKDYNKEYAKDKVIKKAKTINRLVDFLII